MHPLLPTVRPNWTLSTILKTLSTKEVHRQRSTLKEKGPATWLRMELLFTQMFAFHSPSYRIACESQEIRAPSEKCHSCETGFSAPRGRYFAPSLLYISRPPATNISHICERGLPSGRPERVGGVLIFAIPAS